MRNRERKRRGFIVKAIKGDPGYFLRFSLQSKLNRKKFRDDGAVI